MYTPYAEEAKNAFDFSRCVVYVSDCVCKFPDTSI